MDRICSQFVTERKLAFLREQSSEVKEKSDTTRRDLLTLLVQANLRDTDGMSDSDVRARKGSPHALSAPSHNLCFLQRSVPSSSLVTGRSVLQCLGHFSAFVEIWRHRENSEKSFWLSPRMIQRWMNSRIFPTWTWSSANHFGSTRLCIPRRE